MITIEVNVDPLQLKAAGVNLDQLDNEIRIFIGGALDSYRTRRQDIDYEIEIKHS